MTRDGQKRIDDPLEGDPEAQEERADLHEPEPWEDLDEGFEDDELYDPTGDL